MAVGTTGAPGSPWFPDGYRVALGTDTSRTVEDPADYPPDDDTVTEPPLVEDDTIPTSNEPAPQGSPTGGVVRGRGGDGSVGGQPGESVPVPQPSVTTPPQHDDPQPTSGPTSSPTTEPEPGEPTPTRTAPPKPPTPTSSQTPRPVPTRMPTPTPTEDDDGGLELPLPLPDLPWPFLTPEADRAEATPLLTSLLGVPSPPGTSIVVAVEASPAAPR